MYVRWKKRPLSRRLHPEGGHGLTAVLVASERTTGARAPRQRIVAYLSTIQSTKIRYPLPLDAFWQRVDARLGQVAGLTPKDRLTLEQTIATVVPRPPAEDVARAREGLRRMGETLRAMIGPRSAYKSGGAGNFVGTTTST